VINKAILNIYVKLSNTYSLNLIYNRIEIKKKGWDMKQGHAC